MVKLSADILDPEGEVQVDEDTTFCWKLIVLNDDFNTFEHVIQSFMEVLKHTPEQAYQCAIMIHTKGKYAVKEGDSYELLTPFRDALTERGLDARIEE